MTDYSELVKSLREATGWKNATKHYSLMGKAADAIEELQKDLERSKEYETFWEKEANEALKKFQVAVASKPRWIPVTERLPQDAGIYIICDHYGNVMSRHFCKSHGKFAGYWHFNGSAKYGNPTHWMPLPEPPKKETE